MTDHIVVDPINAIFGAKSSNQREQIRIAREQLNVAQNQEILAQDLLAINCVPVEQRPALLQSLQEARRQAALRAQRQKAIATLFVVGCVGAFVGLAYLKSVLSPDTPAQTASIEVAAPAQATETAPPLQETTAPAQETTAAVQAAPAQPTPFQLGQEARRTWEGWFASTSGKFRQGAEWWADYRSRHPSCASLGDQQWQAGCIAAKAQLDQVDAYRQANPQYRAGWNSF